MGVNVSAFISFVKAFVFCFVFAFVFVVVFFSVDVDVFAFVLSTDAFLFFSPTICYFAPRRRRYSYRYRYWFRLLCSSRRAATTAAASVSGFLFFRFARIPVCVRFMCVVRGGWWCVSAGDRGFVRAVVALPAEARDSPPAALCKGGTLQGRGKLTHGVDACYYSS